MNHSHISQIHGTLPAPVRWNAERTWSVAICLRQPTLYILRDHVNMLTDLGRDWVSGPAADYQRFTPMLYAFRLELHHYELNLYVNDHNIIDKPLIRNENGNFNQFSRRDSHHLMQLFLLYGDLI
jgi:hypothetical protein